MYKVIVPFVDLEDYQEVKGGKVYRSYAAGDDYPRTGKEVSGERLAELSGSENKRGMPLIEQVSGGSSSDGVEVAKTQAKRTRKKSTGTESTDNE